VLGHFSSHSVPHVHVSDDTLMPPRHSTSSTATTTTSVTPTMTSADGEGFADKLSFVGSLRSQVAKSFKSHAASHVQSPTPSVWSLPMHQAGDPSASMSTPALPRKQSTIRLPFAPKGKPRLSDVALSDSAAPHVAYSSGGNKGTLPRVSFPTQKRHKRRKKLIVNGIGVHEVSKFEAMKAWCEVRYPAHPASVNKLMTTRYAFCAEFRRGQKNNAHA